MSRDLHITYNGKEIVSPVGRAVAVVIMGMGFIVMMLGVILLIATIPIMLVLHPFFVLFGRRGTMREDIEDGRRKAVLALDRESFRRAR